MSYVCAIFGISNVIGLILTLSIEIPVSSMCKLVFLKKDTEDKSNGNEMAMNQNTAKTNS